MAYETIKYDCTDDIAVITLNDPSTLNAASIHLAKELRLALEQAGEDARCVIITGEGRGFCSGANLSGGDVNTKSEAKRKPDAGEALDSTYNPLMMAIKEHPTPVLTAVNGAAAGVGCALALMGDMVIAGESAYFLQAFSRIGLVPDGGSTWLLAKTIGRTRAMEMALLAEKVPASTALDWGLVNKVVPDDQLMEETKALATRLANGPKSLVMTRKLVWDACDDDFASALHSERVSQRDAGRTNDFKEGVSAFLEKRKAEFKGQ